MQKIEYTYIPELGMDKPMFRCERRLATLQVAACASMWEQGNTKGAPEHLERCRGCQVGSQHAGKGEVTQSPLFASQICSRCQRTSMRMVGHNLCVSCYNRQCEMLRGANAKGQPPKLHPPLFPVQVLVSVGGKPKVVKAEKCADTIEVVVAMLRDESKRVLFSFYPKARPKWAQAELWI